MKFKIVFFIALITGLVLLSGCNEKPAEKMEIVGNFALEAGSQCGKYGITSFAGEKYFADFNSDFVKGLANGDEVSVFGTVISENNCKKIIPETMKVLERKGIIVKGALVLIDYIESLKDGNVFGTSLKEIAEKAGLAKEKFEPLKFYAGSGKYADASGKLLSEIAKSVIGLRKGDELNLEIPPEKGFGVYDPKKIIPVNRDEWPLPRNVDPDIGVEVSGVFGTYAVVKNFDENFIYFDLNPKYAGKTLEFWLKVLDYNNETAKEFESIVEEGDTVKVDYIGELFDGNVFDSSEGRAPLEFIVGAGQMIKGFDNAVLGMKVGEEKTVVITPDEAYGERNERLVIAIDKNSTDYKSLGRELSVREFLDSASAEFNGVEKRGALVSKIDENSVYLDFNHKLAGKTLKFKIIMREITKGG